MGTGMLLQGQIIHIFIFLFEEFYGGHRRYVDVKQLKEMFLVFCLFDGVWRFHNQATLMTATMMMTTPTKATTTGLAAAAGVYSENKAPIGRRGLAAPL